MGCVMAGKSDEVRMARAKRPHWRERIDASGYFASGRNPHSISGVPLAAGMPVSCVGAGSAPRVLGRRDRATSRARLLERAA